MYRTVERVVTTTQPNLIESVALLVMRTLQTEFPQAMQVDVAVTEPALPVPGIYDPFTVSVSTAQE